MSPALFLKGFENVHKELPRDGNQVGLMRVKPVHESQRCLYPTCENLTLPLSQTRLVRTTSWYTT